LARSSDNTVRRVPAPPAKIIATVLLEVMAALTRMVDGQHWEVDWQGSG